MKVETAVKFMFGLKSFPLYALRDKQSMCM